MPSIKSSNSAMTDAEKLAPFLDDICAVADASGLKPLGFGRGCLAALVMRESGATWAKGYTPQGDPKGTGDGGHGHGLCQIDDRYWGDWLAHNEWWVPKVNLTKACDILRSDRNYFASLPTMPGLGVTERLRVIVAAYNCGPHHAKLGLLHGNPDEKTAGGDYSKWIIAKAADLRVQIPALCK